MIRYLAVLVIFTAACDPDPPTARVRFDIDCRPDTAERRAQFIVDCAKAANPMSDEEREDLVKQCESTAKHLFGHSVKMAWRSDDYSDIPCDQATDPIRKSVCN